MTSFVGIYHTSLSIWNTWQYSNRRVTRDNLEVLVSHQGVTVFNFNKGVGTLEDMNPYKGFHKDAMQICETVRQGKHYIFI